MQSPPVALNESEYRFVCDLKEYVDSNAGILSTKNIEIYLLRNRTRGKGIGFFEAEGFYPDFILWILNSTGQHIIFIEPHGLRQEKWMSGKILLHKKIKDVEARLLKEAQPSALPITLDSYILSWTRYVDLGWRKKQEELEQLHILFMMEDNNDYIGKLISPFVT